MSYIDGLPPAAAVNLTDLVVLDQGGTGVPGSATTKSATILQLFGGATTPFLPLVGGTLTGPLIGTSAAFTSTFSLGNSSTSASNILETINAPAATGRKIQWQTAGVGRFDLGLSVVAESGSNVGADLTVQRRSDAGAIIDAPLQIMRSTGQFQTPALGTVGTLSGTQTPQLLSQLSLTSAASAGVVGDSVWKFNITSDNAALNPANFINYFRILANNTGGPNLQGHRQAFISSFNWTAASGNADVGAGGHFYGAGEFLTNVSAGDGGLGLAVSGPASGQSNGHFYALNPVVIGFAGATNVRALNVAEFDISVRAGASVSNKTNITLVDLANDAVQGSVNDNRLAFGAGANTVGALNLIQFGGFPSSNPSDPTNGTLISARLTADYAAAPFQTRFGIDLLEDAFPAFSTTRDAGVFRSAGFAVDGAGTVRQGSFYHTWSSAALAIDGKGAVGSAVAIAATGAGWAPTDAAFDAWGGIYTVPHTKALTATVVSGGSGGSNGAVTITGTTGTGTKFQATGTIAGGALGGALVVTVAGSYTANPTDITVEPVTGGSLVGATVALTMGALDLAVYTDANGTTRYPAYPSTTPPGNPVTLTRWGPGNGVGLTATLTWNTTATRLDLQPSGAATTIGGTLAVTGTLSGAGVTTLLAPYALLASPSLTGTPLSTTAAVDTNTTQIATTAFVLAQASAVLPLINGTATIGTATRFARSDHIHPTDTTRAALTGATFAGTVSIGTNATQQILQMNGPVANRTLIWSTANSKRWQVFANSTAEGGANAGSDLQIQAFDDAAALLTTPLTITRSTGVVTIPNLTVGTLAKMPAYTVAGLPAASGNIGAVAYVTDATAPTYRGALTGGGAVKCLVFSDGTTWTSQ